MCLRGDFVKWVIGEFNASPFLFRFLRLLWCKILRIFYFVLVNIYLKWKISPPCIYISFIQSKTKQISCHSLRFLFFNLTNSSEAYLIQIFMRNENDSSICFLTSSPCKIIFSILWPGGVFHQKLRCNQDNDYLTALWVPFVPKSYPIGDLGVLLQLISNLLCLRKHGCFPFSL